MSVEVIIAHGFLMLHFIIIVDARHADKCGRHLFRASIYRRRRDLDSSAGDVYR